MDLRNVRVIELSEASISASRWKRASRSGVAGERCRQRLDGNLTPELRVPGLPHFTHPAAAEGGQDLVMRQGRPDHLASFVSAQRSPVLDRRRCFRSGICVYRQSGCVSAVVLNVRRRTREPSASMTYIAAPSRVE
jgi:hypothetical protein